MELIRFQHDRKVDILFCQRNGECFDGSSHDFMVGSVMDVRYKFPDCPNFEILECCIKIRCPETS